MAMLSENNKSPVLGFWKGLLAIGAAGAISAISGHMGGSKGATEGVRTGAEELVTEIRLMREDVDRIRKDGIQTRLNVDALMVDFVRFEKTSAEERATILKQTK